MVQWYWKSDLRGKDEASWVWTPYSAKDNKKIEAAYSSKKKKMDLSAKYGIDFRNMVQHRADDYDRQRDIKREDESDSDSSSDDAPPRKKAKKFFSGTTICMSGTLSKTRPQWSTIIESHGGSTSTTVTHSTDYLVTTPEDVKETTQKVYDARSKGVVIVTEAWLKKCIKESTEVGTKGYVMK